MRIGFFGFGNMGKAISMALQSEFKDVEFFTYTPSGKSKIDEMPLDLDYYFLAFKPQSLDEFHFSFSPDHKIISLLAGVSVEKLVNKFAVKKIVRFMPNTPVVYRQGAGLIYYSDSFTDTEKNNITQLLSTTGKVFLMPSEDQLDRITGFSGSGPGLIFELARIFEEELIALSGEKDIARELVAQTFLGAATLMSHDSQNSFLKLRENVTSKNGITYEALKVLSENNLQDIFKRAFTAAYRRTQDFK